MSTPFLGEIKIVSFNFPPRGWAAANGQSLPVNQNQALYALFQNQFGGNTTAFNLPDLRGRSAMGFGTAPNNGPSYTVGQQIGAARHALLAAEIPPHNHTAYVSTVTTQHSPNGTDLPGSGGEPFYDSTATANNVMAGGALSNTGSGQPHENRMPFLTLNFIVALQGIFPSRN